MPRSGQTRPRFASPLTSIEICAGAGGQAVGLHNAGFDHRALVEWDSHAVDTLRANVGGWPGWDQRKADELRPMDVKDFLGSEVRKSSALNPETSTCLRVASRARHFPWPDTGSAQTMSETFSLQHSTSSRPSCRKQ